MAADPFGDAAKWARAAGYSDVKEGAKVRAHHLMRSPAVQAAAFEVARGTFSTVGPLIATDGLLKIAKNRKHPSHFKALLAIANRVGLHEMTEHVVNVSHTDRTAEAMLERITKLAAVLGVDTKKLLGVNAAPMIEGEVINEKADGQGLLGRRDGDLGVPNPG